MAKSYEIEEARLVLDGETARLTTRAGDDIELRHQTREVLALLARSPGQLVTKEDFARAVWDGRMVSDDSLVQCIAEIRSALGDEGRRIIRTVPRKGYRFVPPATAAPSGPRLRGRWMAMAALGVLALVAVVLWGAERGGSERRTTAIAVLPLEDLSPAPHRGYLSDALSEGVITELARFPQFLVIARNSSFQFRGVPTDVREIGDRLGVDYVVEGSQQFDGERIRVTVQLIETESGSHVFSDQIERDLSDLFEVQNMIVRQVSSSVGETVMIDSPPRLAPGDVDARLRGFQARKLASQLSYENWQKALALEEQSVREEPQSAWGYIGKSLMIGTGVGANWIPDREAALAEATALARTAMEIAPDNYLSHHALGRVLSRQGKNHEAILQFERAAALNPSDPIVWIGMARPLRHIGDPEKALEVLERAAMVDPMHGDWLRAETAMAHWQLGECENGLASLDSMARTPDYSFPIRVAVLVCLDRIPEARDVLDAYRERRADFTLEQEMASTPANWMPEGTAERWINGLRLAGLE
ncbi:MAG: winged helix-turn-helix domain-containing tetratricopeptide repeat protein [Pseudooceanicola sp.]